MSNKVKITIDNKEYEVNSGSMLIEVTDQVGIHVPRFCYHKKLSVAANCRMCLVEVEKAPKPMPACATPVADGMKVWTRSEKALTAQKDTMEFLLINHPLDCPICDQGGECELQDLSMGFGGSSSSYHEVKRVVADKDIGPLVATEMTRCIQCTRCVRFGEEIAGMRELGALGRGDRMQIGTFVEHSLTSELSGNIIDICPVGALTAKPSRYTARSWEMLQTPGIGAHDSVGSNINLHTFKQRLIRVVSDTNESINECWISDRDRFAYEGVHAEDRLKTPMIKQNGIWKKVSWEEALAAVTDRIQSFSADQIGVLASPGATTEELYLLQKAMRARGVNNIDHRLRQTDFKEQESMGMFPGINVPIAEIENVDAVLLIASNVQKDQPLINHRIRKAALKGAKVMSVNTRSFNANYELDVELKTTPSSLIHAIATIAKASITLSKKKIPEHLAELFKEVRVNSQSKAIVQNLLEAKNPVVFIGNSAFQNPYYSTLKVLSEIIAENTGAKFGCLTDAANTAGAWIAGVLPHRKEAGEVAQEKGKNAFEMLNDPLQAYFLLDVEPEFDCDNPDLALNAMHKAECVVAITPYAGAQMLSYADIVLPSAGFGETSGTYINTEGVWQSFRAAAKNYYDARPAWKILRVLGNSLGVEGFDYVSSEDVLNELRQIYDASGAPETTDTVNGDLSLPPLNIGGIERIGDVAEFCGDSLVRRAQSLQESAPEQACLHLSGEEIERLGLLEALKNTDQVVVKQGEKTAKIALMQNDSVPSGCALLFSGTQASSLLGSAFGTIEITA